MHLSAWWIYWQAININQLQDVRSGAIYFGVPTPRIQQYPGCSCCGYPWQRKRPGSQGICRAVSQLSTICSINLWTIICASFWKATLLKISAYLHNRRPGFEETEENITNLMESRLQDHERIRGGLYFIQAIPRDENWKVRRDLLVDYKPITTEEVILHSWLHWNDKVIGK